MSSRRVVPDAHASWTAVNVRGTPGPDRISVSARHVLVRSLTGADRVRAGGRVVEVYGGRGADRLKVGGLDRLSPGAERAGRAPREQGA